MIFVIDLSKKNPSPICQRDGCRILNKTSGSQATLRGLKRTLLTDFILKPTVYMTHHCGMAEPDKSLHPTPRNNTKT